MRDIPEADRTATLIYWNPGISREEINKALDNLKNLGLVENETTDDYISDWGSPVWYIP